MSTHNRILIGIPEGTPWPVEGRDPTTGSLILAVGFLETVAEASGLALGADGTDRRRLTQDMVSELLLAWYAARLDAGEPHCEILDSLITEVRRASLH